MNVRIIFSRAPAELKMKPAQDKQIRQIALLVSYASALQIMESFIPNPFPGIRLGLANIITLIALIRMGPGISLQIAAMRALMSSFIMGTFLSPSFFLSFSGALTSALAMGLFYKLTAANKKIYFSLTGISMIGALTHNLTQLILVYFILINNKGIFLLLPWLCISAVITGWLTGLIASGACKKLDGAYNKGQENTDCGDSPDLRPADYAGTNSPVRLLAPEIKILLVAVLLPAVLLFNSIPLSAGLLLCLSGAAWLSGVPFAALFVRIRKFSLFIFSSFLLPVLFNKGGEILLAAGPLELTQGGLEGGAILSFRVLLLLSGSSLLILTASSEELISGLEKILVFLKLSGPAGKQVSAVMIQAWDFQASSREKVLRLIKAQDFKGKSPKDIIPSLDNLVYAVYKQAEKEIT